MEKQRFGEMKELGKFCLELALSPIGWYKVGRQAAKEFEGRLERRIILCEAVALDITKYFAYGLIFKDFILPYLQGGK